MTEDEEQPNVGEGTTRRPGHELRAARERAGIERDELATTLHLPEEQVEAIEADDYARLPVPAFVRGYLRAYAREVGLDADEIVAEFDAASGETGDPEIVLHMGEPDPAGGHGALVALAIVVLVAGIGMGAWWWQQGGGVRVEPVTESADGGATMADPDAGAAGEAAETGGTDAAMGGEAAANAPEAGTAEPSAPEPPADSGGGTTGETAAADDAETATESAAASGEPETQAAGTETASAGGTETGTTEPAEAAEANESADTGAGAEDDASTASDADTDPEPEAMVAEGDRPRVTSSAAEVATEAAATGPDTLVIEIDGRSWLEVFDVRGRQLAYTLYSGNEPVRLQGYAPFDVFLGNAPAVTLRFGDQPVDQSAFIRSDNTARFVVDAEGASRR